MGRRSEDEPESEDLPIELTYSGLGVWQKKLFVCSFVQRVSISGGADGEDIFRLERNCRSVSVKGYLNDKI